MRYANLMVYTIALMPYLSGCSTTPHPNKGQESRLEQVTVPADAVEADVKDLEQRALNHKIMEQERKRINAPDEFRHGSQTPILRIIPTR